MGRSTIYVLVLLVLLNVAHGAEGPTLSSSSSKTAEGPTLSSAKTAEGPTLSSAKPADDLVLPSNKGADGLSLSSKGPQGASQESSAGTMQKDPLDPTTASEWMAQGRLALKAKRRQEALECFEQAVLRDPKNVEALLEAGAILGKMGRLEGALAKFLSALIIDKKNVTAHFNAGQAYLQIKKPAKAIYHFKQVLQYKERDWMAREKLLQLYQKMGKFNEAEKERDYLIDMFKKGEVPVKSFVREEFELGPYFVVAYENFMHSVLGRRPVFLNFVVFTRKYKNYLRRFSLASFEVTNEIARRSGRLKEGERLYHLDVIEGRKSRERHQVVSWVKKPTYADVRRVVYERLEKRAEENK